MSSREKPSCRSCIYFDTSTKRPIGGFEAARTYTQTEQDGGLCTRASTPFRQPVDGVCACYEGPALPRSRFFGAWYELRVRRSLAQDALDSLASARDDAAVLRCALSGVWHRACDARARSHELWAFLTPALTGGLLPDAPVWRDRVSNVTTAISRIVMSLGDMAKLHAIKDAGITDLGIHMPELDTGCRCEDCGADMKSREFYDDVTKRRLCHVCADKAGVFSRPG